MHSPILSASPRRARRLVRFAAAALCGIVTATAAPAHAAPTLGAGQGFPCGHYLKSPNGYFRFVYQCDGNLVLYDKANHAMWASNTNGKPSTRLIMQGDGNLVLYNGNKPVWASATDKHPGAAVRMQDDGNLVIFLRSVALWASRTSANCDQPKVCLYDGTTPSGYVVYDTAATTIANYASPLRRLHNGTPLDNHTSSIRNNSNATVCFYDGANYTGAKLCLAPHTSNANLGTLNNRISSHKAEPTCVNPFAGVTGWRPDRTDQGVDYIATTAYPVKAICDGLIVNSGPSYDGWEPWWLTYKFTSGPLAGKCVFIAEHLVGALPAGTVVKAGQVIATATGGTEWGWARSWMTPSDPYNGSPDGTKTEGGKSFARFLRSLGATTLDDPGPGPMFYGTPCP